MRLVDISLRVMCYRYLNAIQTQCPHILRYLTTAVITNNNKRRKNVVKDLVKVIQQVSLRMTFSLRMTLGLYNKTVLSGNHDYDLMYMNVLCLQESYTYKDPITEFLECLYVNFDFDGAQRKLRECETVSKPTALVALNSSIFTCGYSYNKRSSFSRIDTILVV